MKKRKGKKGQKKSTNSKRNREKELNDGKEGQARKRIKENEKDQIDYEEEEEQSGHEEEYEDEGDEQEEGKNTMTAQRTPHDNSLSRRSKSVISPDKVSNLCLKHRRVFYHTLVQCKRYP
jgi:hypothetical protein